MNKTLVFLIDALCTCDLEDMQAMPVFARLMNEGSVVRHIEPVYPSLTYPCHVSILTGCYPRRHHIIHNEKVQVENPHAPWYSQYRDIAVKTIFDYANVKGLSCASLSWPVTGGAPIRFNLPMIVPIDYAGEEPEQYLTGNATPYLMQEYFWKYRRYLCGPGRNLDAFTMAMALDLLEHEEQPDLFLVKMCDLDTAKHIHGVRDAAVTEQLRKHDRELAALLEALRRKGTLDATNIVILGDHGQADVKKRMNLNVLLRQNGFLQTDEAGQLLDYEAYCFSASLSAWITLKHPEDRAMQQKMLDFLLDLKHDPAMNIGYVLTRPEFEALGLDGPFSFVVEGREIMEFTATLQGNDIFAPYVQGGFVKASHGYLPFRDQTTALIAWGPDYQKGRVLERDVMVNEGPTIAATLGLDMNDADGQPIVEILAGEKTA